MPTVGDFAATIDIAEGRIGAEEIAEIQAGAVLDHLRRYGSCVCPDFEDPVTRYLMNSRWRYSSWSRYIREDDLKWWRQEFLRAYKAHSAGVSAGYSISGKKIMKIAQQAVKRIPIFSSS